MNRIPHFLVLILLMHPLGLAAQKPPKADQVVADAKAKAAEQHKSIFLIFGASWCGECHSLDSFLDESEIRAIFDKYFVIARLSVAEELGNHPNLNNSGSDKLMGKFGGIGSNGEVGLPFLVVLDQTGKPLINSNRRVKGKPAGDGIGFPTEPEEIAWFLTMLKNGGPLLTSDEARLVEAKLRR